MDTSHVSVDCKNIIESIIFYLKEVKSATFSSIQEYVKKVSFLSEIA